MLVLCKRNSINSPCQDIVDWYTAIRSAKLNRLQVAFPGVNELELAKRLTRNFPMEGWLWKRGPRAGDSYKKRWFTLDDRKLMYLLDPLVRMVLVLLVLTIEVQQLIFGKNVFFSHYRMLIQKVKYF